MNILSKSFPRAQFWSDFQIFGIKMLGGALSIKKNIEFFLDGVSQTKNWEEGPNLKKNRDNYDFSWFFMFFGACQPSLNFYIYFFGIGNALPNILVPNI